MTGSGEDDAVEVVYGYVRTDPEDPSSVERRTRSVPTAWYESVERADAVLQRVKDEWIHETGVRSVGLSPGSIDDSEESTSIVVSIDEAEADAGDRLPDSVEGVSVEVEFVDPDEGRPL